jgi:hypothetical protein
MAAAIWQASSDLSRIGAIWNESIGAAVQKSTVFDCRIRKTLLRKQGPAP